MSNLHPLPALLAVVTVVSIAGHASAANENVTTKKIEKRVRDALRNDARVDDQHISLSVKEGVVTLSGTVKSLANRQFAVREAEKINGVIGVIDKLTTVAQVRPDKEVARDVENRIAHNPLVKSDKLDVACDRGAVTLTGEVEDYAQWNIAGELATEVLGVKDVKNKLLMSGAPQRSDEAIRDEVVGLLARDVFLGELPIAVKVEAGVVRLEGKVGSAFERRRAGERILYVSHIKRVQNDLNVEPMLDRATRQSTVVSDQELAENVRRELRTDSRITAKDVAVHAMDGEIVLQGLVPFYFQRGIAEQDAHNVFGVAMVKNELQLVPVERSDATIRKELMGEFHSDAMLHDQNIDVLVKDGVVSLSGSVYNWDDKSRATRIARRIHGVKAVGNDLSVYLAGKQTDSELIGNIRDRLRWDYSTAPVAPLIKVAVNDGVTTLSGEVAFWSQRQAAGAIATHTAGIWRVENQIKVAKYDYAWERWYHDGPFPYDPLYSAPYRYDF